MRNRYPHVQIVFRPFQAPDVCQLVREGTLDIALALEEPIHSAKLMMKPLFPERLQVIAAPSHPLAGAQRLEAADLEGETIIVTENKCSYRSLFERSLADADVQPAEIIEVTTVEAIKQCIMVGMGISILPEIATRTEIERGTIVVLPWQLPDITVITQLVWHREKWLSPALHAFIDTATTMQW